MTCLSVNRWLKKSSCKDGESNYDTTKCTPNENCCEREESLVIDLISLIFIIILLLVFGFYYFLGFINPASIQIQLLGILLVLFGGFLYLNQPHPLNFMIMTLGLMVGAIGSFKSNENSTNE